MKSKIVNTIDEQYVSKEVAILLKELGFNVPVQSFVSKHSLKPLHFVDETCLYVYRKEDDRECLSYINDDFLAPTQSVTIEWLRVNFDVFIWSSFSTVDDSTTAWEWHVKTYLPEGKDRCKDTWDFYTHETSMDEVRQVWYETPQEALEAALLFTCKTIRR